jgi:hypothetical protein
MHVPDESTADNKMNDPSNCREVGASTLAAVNNYSVFNRPEPAICTDDDTK